MNNLTINQTQTPFSFLAIQPESQTPANGYNLAWITDRFYLGDNNYYIYSCHSCQKKQIKKGTKPKECLNWGGQNV